MEGRQKRKTEEKDRPTETDNIWLVRQFSDRIERLVTDNSRTSDRSKS